MLHTYLLEAHMSKLKENMSRRSRHGKKVQRWDVHQRIKAEAAGLRSGRKVKLRKQQLSD